MYKFSRPSPYHHHGSIFKTRPQNNPNYRDLLSTTSLYSGILTGHFVAEFGSVAAMIENIKLLYPLTPSDCLPNY